MSGSTSSRRLGFRARTLTLTPEETSMHVGKSGLLGVLLFLSVQVHAAEISVLSAGAVEPGIHAIIDAFRKSTGHEVRVRFATAPALRERVGAGESADLL